MDGVPHQSQPALPPATAPLEPRADRSHMPVDSSAQGGGQALPTVPFLPLLQ